MKKKHKKEVWKKVLHWAPRIISILFVLFISLFALDVFGSGQSFGMMLLGFLVHMMPSFILIGILVIAWNHEMVGAILFAILGLAFTLFFGTYRELISFLIISLPVFVVAGLYYWDYCLTGHERHK